MSKKFYDPRAARRKIAQPRRPTYAEERAREEAELERLRILQAQHPNTHFNSMGWGLPLPGTAELFRGILYD